LLGAVLGPTRYGDGGLGYRDADVARPGLGAGRERAWRGTARPQQQQQQGGCGKCAEHHE
jgi:hypothetical protein